jgi:predicted phosphohydrolase
MKLGWATDVHFNFMERSDVDRFCEIVRHSGINSLLLGGDIAEAEDVAGWLELLDTQLNLPIYFVLGNHDYYEGSISGVRRQMNELRLQSVKWLPTSGCISLSSDIGLVGHGGWGDARHGDFEHSPVILSDYLLIEELRDTVDVNDLADDFTNRHALKQKLKSLGVDSAKTLRPHLATAVDKFKKVIVLTHVSPFPESCWYNNQISDDNWLPGFTCKAMGDLLLEFAEVNPVCDMTVLCGHTHGGGHARLLPNLEIFTGEAKYGHAYLRMLDIQDRVVTIDTL